jgi:hypothetical protein
VLKVYWATPDQYVARLRSLSRTRK